MEETLNPFEPTIGVTGHKGPDDSGLVPPPPRAVLVKLNNPFQLNGTLVKELALDFESLSAQEQIQAERTYRVIYADQQQEAVPAADSRFLLILAGLAAKINHEDLLIHLRGKDYRKVVNRALVFCGGPED